MKTLPSFGALATEAAAISPLAPARFSTTTVRPSRAAMPGAITRARRSLGPPGGKPTTKRSGLSGKSWARAASGSKANPARRERRWSGGIGDYARAISDRTEPLRFRPVGNARTEDASFIGHIHPAGYSRTECALGFLPRGGNRMKRRQFIGAGAALLGAAAG